VLQRLHTTPVLLDDQNRIVSVCSASSTDAPLLQLGADFFSLFPADARELAALDRCRLQATPAFLMRAGERPMIALCHSTYCTGLTTILLPYGHYAALLDHPAAYFSAFPSLVFSPASLCRHAPARDQHFQTLSTWLNELLHPFPLRVGSDLSPLRLELFAHRFATLLDCKLQCSFFALNERETDTVRAMGHLTAALLVAADLAGGKTVTALGEWLEPFGPLITVSFPCIGGTLPSTLTSLSQYASDRGAVFTFAQNENEAQIAFTVAPIELSAQGVKAIASPDRGLVISRETVEKPVITKAPIEPIPLFHNGKWAPGAACKKKDDT
jgi:hypothetical protein